MSCTSDVFLVVFFIIFFLSSEKATKSGMGFVVMSHRDVSSMGVSTESFKCQGRAIYNGECHLSAIRILTQKFDIFKGSNWCCHSCWMCVTHMATRLDTDHWTLPSKMHMHKGIIYFVAFSLSLHLLIRVGRAGKLWHFPFKRTIMLLRHWLMGDWFANVLSVPTDVFAFW